MIGLLWLSCGCGPAQIGPDEESFKAVDALYTAVTSKKPELLDRCEKRLKELNAAGKLSSSAHRELEAIIKKSRAGDWRPAAEQLSEFMKGQRRNARTH